MRDDSTQIFFQSFLQEALVSRSGMGRDVHSLMLSIQHFLCRPRRRPASKVPRRIRHSQTGGVFPPPSPPSCFRCCCSFQPALHHSRSHGVRRRTEQAQRRQLVFNTFPPNKQKPVCQTAQQSQLWLQKNVPTRQQIGPIPVKRTVRVSDRWNWKGGGGR